MAKISYFDAVRACVQHNYTVDFYSNNGYLINPRVAIKDKGGLIIADREEFLEAVERAIEIERMHDARRESYRDRKDA